jgi:hypothetical protein
MPQIIPISTAEELIIVVIYKKADKQIVIIIKAYQSYHIHTNFVQHPSVKVNFICR